MKVNREHFSWSQYDLWHRSKREFWKRYHLGAPEKTNRFFDKGKELAQFLETGAEVNNKADGFLGLVADVVPKLDIPEQELTFFVNTKTGEKKVLCYIDSGSFDGTCFVEYKTGKIEWNQERVDELDQLRMYALGYYKNFGTVPICQLAWIETMEDEEDGLIFTGKVETFDRMFSIQELWDFEAKIEATIQEIEEFEYEELELDNEDVERYAHLKNIIEEAELEMAEIKMKIEAQMLEADVKFGKGNVGNFIFTERKSWEYSEVVDELKKDIAKQQKQEQKDGTAKFTVNKSLTFKLNTNK